MRRILLTLLAVVLSLAVLGQPVGAHSGKQSYLYLSLYDGVVEGRVEIPVVDLGPAIGVEIPQGGAAGPVVQEHLTVIQDYLTRNVALRDDSGEWPLEFAGWSLLDTGRGTYATFPFVADVSSSEAPRDFVANFSAVIENDPNKDALLLIENDFGTAVFDNESEHLLGFSTGNTEQRVVLTDGSLAASMVAVGGIGIDEVRVGIDVMLVGVATTAMLICGSAPRAIRGLAAFAAGQAVALWIVGLLASPSARFTDLVGALAALLAGAACVVVLVRPVPDRVVVVGAALIGVVQGAVLGGRFAGRRLDETAPIASALGHHAGVLIATAIVVALTALPLLILHSTRWARPLAIGVGVVVALYGLAWTGEWLADADWPIERVANPWRVWPRNLLLVAAVVAVAVVLRRRSTGSAGPGSARSGSAEVTS